MKFLFSPLVSLIPVSLFAQATFFEPVNGPSGPATFKALSVTPVGVVFAISQEAAYRSQDNGRSWDSLEVAAAGSVLNTVYGIGNDTVYLASAQQGVFRSTNGGTTWISPSQHIDARVIALSPWGELYAGAYYEKIYKSTDYGSSWIRRDTSLIGSPVTGIAFEGSATVFVTTSPGGRVYRSTNRGETWNTSDAGITGQGSSGIVRTTAGTLLAAVAGNVFRSTDSGNSWTQTSFPASQAPKLAVHPSGSVFAGMEFTKILRSTNDGNSWEQMASGYAPYAVWNLAVGSSGTLYAASTYTLHSSTDQGVSWSQQSAGLYDLSVYSLALSPQGRIFLGTQNSGIYTSDDHGQSWRHMGLDNTRVTALAAGPNGEVAAGSFNGPTYFSTDSGETWNTGSTLGQALSVKRGNDGNYYFCGAGVFKSTNGGASWSPIGLSSDIVYEIAESGGVLLARTNTGLKRSTNGGQQWTLSSNGLTGTSVYSVIAVSATEFLATSNGIAEGTVAVHRSTDAGLNWSRVDTGEGLVGAGRLLRNPQGGLIILWGNRAYGSIDQGTSWDTLDIALPQGGYASMIMDPSGFLYYSAFGHGVFRSLVTTTSVGSRFGSSPHSFMLEQNYPNPFNPTTIIKYQLSVLSRVKLSVFDMLGREVTVLVDGELEAGTHSASWTADGPSGVYYYRLEAVSKSGERRTETRKMMVLK